MMFCVHRRSYAISPPNATAEEDPVVDLEDLEDLDRNTLTVNGGGATVIMYVPPTRILLIIIGKVELESLGDMKVGRYFLK
jgi:hypothetical protein